MKEIIKKLEAVKQEMQKGGEDAVKEYFEKLFERFPELFAVRWEQYTAYFNDGEQCYFNVYEPDLALTAQGLLDEGIEDKDPEEFFSQYDLDKGALCDALRELHSDMDSAEELLEMVFGDHARVTVTRDGITVEEYADHD